VPTCSRRRHSPTVAGFVNATPAGPIGTEIPRNHAFRTNPRVSPPAVEPPPVDKPSQPTGPVTLLSRHYQRQLKPPYVLWRREEQALAWDVSRGPAAQVVASRPPQ